MSKLAERLPAIQTSEERLELTTSLLDNVIQNGRFEKDELVQAVQLRLGDYEVNEELLISEGRKSIADSFVAAFANSRTIRFDRKQRVPVYQMDFGFAGSFFKVGSTFVQPHAMTLDDFDVMIERIEHRIENAQTDLSIITDFRDRARPGLEAGQNLVEQFDAGVLELASVSAIDALVSGEEEA